MTSHMTAAALVADIFSRPQADLPPEMRRVTHDQFKYLRDLMLKEDGRGTVRHGSGGSLVWTPPGEKYVLTEHRESWKFTLTKMSKVDASGPGLFDDVVSASLEP